MVRQSIFAIALFVLTACGDPIGDECQLRSGALGFGFADDCKSKCLQLYDVTCPDQSRIRRSICAGDDGCDPGSCGEGEICYSFEDPIEKYFYCIPDNFCGDGLSTQQATAWELEARKRSDKVREKFSARMKKHTSATTKPVPAAQPLVDNPPLNSSAGSALEADPRTTASVLIESWGSDMALVMCINNGRVETGAQCARYLPVGIELNHGSWHVRSTGPKNLSCAAMHPVPGVGGEIISSIDHVTARWSWVPKPPAGFSNVTLQALDPALLAVAKTVIPGILPSMKIELAAITDLDGNGAKERIIRTFIPSDDPDKPGRTTLWMVDEHQIIPLPTDGLELNGVQQVHGVLRLQSGRDLLVFTSEWMGGSATHVVGFKQGKIGPIAQVACGS